jgi:hypothetical protein
MGDSGSRGAFQLGADEMAGGAVLYFRRHDAKLTMDATYLNGAPIDSASLDMSPGDIGWLFRSQIQFSF